MAKTGHWQTIYTYGPGGEEKPQSVWVKDDGTPSTATGTSNLPSQEAYIADMVEAGFTQEQAQANWEFITTGIVAPGEDKLKLEKIGTPPTYPTLPPTEPLDEDGVPCSISGKPPVTPMEVTPAPAVAPPPTITPPTVTPAPPYEQTPEEIAFQAMYSGKLTDWVEAGGYGIPEETQAQMIQQTTDILKARETENIRVMTNNMERRGLTNSGLLYANTQAIRSNTTKEIAGAIADVQIKSALMKLASFENAMGRTGQFLDYLSTQSQLKYAPELATWSAQTQADFAAWQANTGGTLEQWRMTEGNKFATWQAEQMAKMAAWQETMDRQKMAINQAYQQQNIKLTAQLQSELATQQHQWDVEMAEMEIEATQEMAKAEGQGAVSGTIITGIFTVLAAVL